MATVSEIKEVRSGQQTDVAKKRNSSRLFDSDMILEQADALLKSTGQYPRWRKLRQNNDKASLWLGKRILERHELLEEWQKGHSIDSDTFDSLTSQLRSAGIHLYTFSQLQPSPAAQLPPRAAAVQKELSPQSSQKNDSSPLATSTPSPPHPARVVVSYPVVSPVTPVSSPLPLSTHAQFRAEPPASSEDAGAQVVSAVLTKPVGSSVPVPPAEDVSPQVPANPSVLVARSTASVKAGASVAISPAILDEDNLLILDLQCPQVGIQKTIFAYADQQTVMLPLSSVLEGLDFSITVDPEHGKAGGWFISEDRSFQLDVDSQQVLLNGTSVPFAPGSVVVGDGDIYVSAKNMASWFPLDFEVSRSELTATMTPREQLPIQARLERQQRLQGISASGQIPLKYPVKDMDYDLFSLPVLDVNLSGGVGSNDLENTYLNGRYSMLAQGDLAYMTSHIFLSGDEDSPTDTARIRLERVSPDAELLGPLQATQVAVGDILPATFPVLQNVTPERGVFLSNESLVHSMDHDSTRFEGNLQPGWEVELYRNDALVMGKTVGIDGRYLFDEVPVYFGKNDFVVKAYGPQGQQKVLDEKSVRVGSQMLPEGDFFYQMSASQRDKTVLGIDERNALQYENSGRFNGRYQYGVTRNLSLGTGLSSVEFGGERHNYLQAGLSGNASFVYGQTDYLYDTATGGSALSLLAQTALGPFNIKAKHDFFSDFVMEGKENSTLVSRTRLDLDGRVEKTELVPAFSYTFSSENTKYTSHDTAQLSNRLATRIRDVYLSNYLVWNYGSVQEDNPVEGQLQATGNIGPVRVTGSVKYRLGDESKVTRYGLTSQWQLGEHLRTGLELVQDTDYYNRTTASARLDWDAGVAMVSPRVSYDSEGKFGSFLTLSWSLGRDPGAGKWDVSSVPDATRGNVSALVYHDLNNNKLFDEGDTPLPGVTVNTVQGRRGSATGEDGHALVSGLPPYVPTDIELDQDTLEDPFWIPSTAGIAVRPRPGHYDQLEIPVVTGGEIDGTVFLTGKNGVREPLANVALEIVDEDGKQVKTIHSEYDGFYLFEKVIPGTYTLRVSPDDQEHTSLASGLEIPIVIGNDGTIVSGTDIILQKPDNIILQDLKSEKKSLLAAAAPSGEPEVLAAMPTGAIPQSVNPNVDSERLSGVGSVGSTEPVGTDPVVAQQSDGPVRLWPDPMDFPLAPTGVIDGTVYVSTPDGNRRTLANVDLEVVDEEGTLVGTVHSDADGFYVVDNLLPGTYTLQVSSADGKYASLAGEIEQSVLIGNDPTVVRGNNLVVQAPVPVSQPVVAQMDQKNNTVAAPPEATVAMQPVENQGMPAAAREQLISASGKKIAMTAGRGVVGTELAGGGGQELLAVVEPGAEGNAQIDVPASSVLPVVEYSLAANQHPGQEVGAREQLETVADGFSIIPQPIVPFTPIQVAAVQPVRRVNPYAADSGESRQDQPLSTSPRPGNRTSWQRLKVIC